MLNRLIRSLKNAVCNVSEKEAQALKTNTGQTNNQRKGKNLCLMIISLSGIGK